MSKYKIAAGRDKFLVTLLSQPFVAANNEIQITIKTPAIFSADIALST
jgi:hypothetical protein